MEKTDLLSLSDFYSADAEALQVKYKQIEHLIGLSHHSGSEGNYCEVLLKEFLRRTLPGHVSVDGGFIRRVSDTDWSRSSSSSVLPSESPIATPQLDIIVHDSHEYAPLFRSEDFVAVLPESVRAVIEVKKRLTQARLNEAVANIGKTKNLLRRWRHQSNKVFTCIFAFSLGDDLDPEDKVYSDSFKNCFAKTVKGGVCDAPDLVIALPRLALHQVNHGKFDYCPTADEDEETPNIAGQFLVFLLSQYTSWRGQGNSLPYPETLTSRRKTAFKLKKVRQ